MPALPAPLPRRPIALVTVSFGADLRLLELQARSFAVHLVREPGRPIFVINNDNDPEGFARAFEREVLPAYGQHAPEVTLVAREACVAGFDRLQGWRLQQLLKWAAAKLVGEGDYLTLDSKNCLLRPWRGSDVFSASGRIRMMRRRLDDTLAPSFRYFNPDLPAPEWVSQIWTPFLILGRHVRAMMAAIEQREGRSCFEVLAAREDLLEYALYWSWLVHRGLDWLYDLHGPSLAAGFWFRDDAEADRVLRFLEQPRVAWFGVHRRVRSADPSLRRRIAALLAERGLFEDVRAARIFLRRLAAT